MKSGYSWVLKMQTYGNLSFNYILLEQLYSYRMRTLKVKLFFLVTKRAHRNYSKNTNRHMLFI